MKEYPALIIQLVTGLLMIGFMYGIFKSKIDELTRGQDAMLKQVRELFDGNMNSRIMEERQSLINVNVVEKIAHMGDQLDMHEIAIKHVESDIIKLKSKHSIQ